MKMPSVSEALNVQQRQYVQNRVKGMKKRPAALAAGYSEAMAEKASFRIETPNVRAEFKRLMQKAVPYQKACQRMAEGVDAMNDDGLPDMKERREYLKLAVAYADYYVEKTELDVSGRIESECGERLAKLLALA